MRIVSTFVPARDDEVLGKNTVLSVFDTFVEQKGLTRNLVVGLVVGVANGERLEDVKVSTVGSRVIARLLVHHELNYPPVQLEFAGITAVNQAKERVRQILTHTPDQSAVVLLCTNAQVYDAVFSYLGVDMASAKPEPQ